jgi:hypothetical protein
MIQACRYCKRVLFHVCKFSRFTVLSLFMMVLISQKISSANKLYNVLQNIHDGLMFMENCQTMNIVILKTLMFSTFTVHINIMIQAYRYMQI